jgi:hypothetical protein
LRDIMSFLFPNIGGPYDGWIALAFAVFITVGWRPVRMIWRMIRPIPQGDAQAIKRALTERNQAFKDLAKLWVGGPWAYVGPRAPIPYQSGRPYSVRVKDQNGRIVDVRLVINGKDARGDPIVMERAAEGWKTISKLGPAVKALVL